MRQSASTTWTRVRFTKTTRSGYLGNQKAADGLPFCWVCLGVTLTDFDHFARYGNPYLRIFAQKFGDLASYITFDVIEPET